MQVAGGLKEDRWRGRGRGRGGGGHGRSRRGWTGGEEVILVGGVGGDG